MNGFFANGGTNCGCGNDYILILLLVCCCGCNICDILPWLLIMNCCGNGIGCCKQASARTTKKAEGVLCFLFVLHFVYLERSYTSTHCFEDGTRGAAATRKRTPSTSICTQSLVRSVFLHQSDKWHNEGTPLNVRAVSVSLPIGLCRMAEGGNM